WGGYSHGVSRFGPKYLVVRYWLLYLWPFCSCFSSQCRLLDRNQDSRGIPGKGLWSATISRYARGPHRPHRRRLGGRSLWSELHLHLYWSSLFGRKSVPSAAFSPHPLSSG